MEPFRVALIGAGRIARVHGRALVKLPGVAVELVHDLDEDAAQALAREVRAEATTSLDDVLNREDIRAVVISTPTPTHADLIVRSAHRGKAVFVEKPIADTMEGAERATRTVREAGVACQVAFQRRHDPSYVQVKRRIETGELGRLGGYRSVGRDPEPPPINFLKTSGGIMVDLAIHELDMARYLVGEVAALHCIGGATLDDRLKEHDLVDAAVGLLRFQNGALGTFEVGLRTAYGYEQRTEIIGEKGRLHVEKPARDHVVTFTDGGGRFAAPDSFEERFREAYVEQLRHFVEHVLTGVGVSPGPEDATETLRLALAAQRSLDTGETVSLSAQD